MPEEHPFSYRTVPKALYAGRYRWNVFRGDQLCESSPISYGTKGDADKAAKAAMLLLVKKWQSER
jgi:hypothetical protein